MYRKTSPRALFAPKSLVFPALLVASIGPLCAASENGALLFSTFLKANSSVKSIGTDDVGNIYLFGDVAESPIPGRGKDLYVAKLDPTAKRVLYFEYLGGSAADSASSMAVDSSGNVYLAGSTLSRDFPTTIPLPVNGGLPNQPFPFAAKLNPEGTLVYAAAFVGASPATASAIAVSTSGEAVISGVSLGSGFQSTPGAAHPLTAEDSTNQPFVVKLDASGAKVIFSVVGIGGNHASIGSTGDIFLAGNTISHSYPTTAGAFQRNFAPFAICIFPCQLGFPGAAQYVTRLSADGSAIRYSTFVAGSQGSNNMGIAVDSQDNAWLTGTTASTDYPHTGQTIGDRQDTFLTAVDPTGSRLLISVRQGGSAIALDGADHIAIGGTFSDATVPQISSGVAFPDPPAQRNVPPACLRNAATITSSLFAEVLSKTSGEVERTQVMNGALFGGVTMTVGPAGQVYLAGQTSLPDIPVSAGAVYDNAIGSASGHGTFLLAFDPEAVEPARVLSCVAALQPGL